MNYLAGFSKRYSARQPPPTRGAPALSRIRAYAAYFQAPPPAKRDFDIHPQNDKLNPRPENIACNRTTAPTHTALCDPCLRIRLLKSTLKHFFHSNKIIKVDGGRIGPNVCRLILLSTHQHLKISNAWNLIVFSAAWIIFSGGMSVNVLLWSLVFILLSVRKSRWRCVSVFKKKGKTFAGCELINWGGEMRIYKYSLLLISLRLFLDLQ